MKHILAILTAVFTCLLLTSCAHGTEGVQSADANTNESLVSSSGAYAYSATSVPLPEDAYCGDFAYVDGESYFTVYKYNEETGEWNYSIYAVNLDGDGRELADWPGERQPLYLTSDKSGGIWCLSADSSGDCERLGYLDNTGAIVKSWDTASLGFDEGEVPISLTAAGDMLYIGVYSDGCSLCAFKVQEGEPKLKYELDVSGAYMAAVTLEGSLLIREPAEIGCELKLVEAEAGDWGKSIELPEFYDIYSGSGDCDVFLAGGSNLYSLDLETGKQEKLLNFVSCGIAYMGNIAAVDGESFLVSADAGSSLLLLTKSQLSGETVALTLALSGNDTEVRADIAKWNREHADIKIEVLDYSIYDVDGSGTASAMRLATDIIAGHLPDIYILDGLPAKSFAERGLLEDLYPYIDADAQLSRSDFFENILKAEEQGGALYKIFPKISVLTAAAGSSFAGSSEGMTLAEMQNVLNSNPSLECIFSMGISRSELLEMLLEMNMDSLVDWENGSCDFESELFIDILELSAGQPEDAVTGEGDAYNYWWDYDQADMLRSGRQLLYVQAIDNINHTGALADLFGENYSFVGLPCSEGCGSAAIPHLSFGISAYSEQKDACWQFIRSFLTDECRAVSGISIRRDITQAKRQEYLDRLANSNSSKGISAETLTARAYELLEAVDKIYSTDDNILSIVRREAAAFFSGAKTAQECARLIQSSVGIYVAEKYG